MMVYGAVLPGQVKTALLSPGNTPAGETATNGCNYVGPSLIALVSDFGVADVEDECSG